MKNDSIRTKEYALKMLASWRETEHCLKSTEELKAWIDSLNQTTKLAITATSVDEDSFWFYDDYKGEILNRKRSFFSIIGLRYFCNEEFVSEQPIILQKEIGYLGIIVKEFDGVLHFLMQAKIEPGNVNFVQLSPTIQATKSNFTRAHGGRLPYYFELFENASESGIVLYDQIQSEQGSRFYGKRNRNILLLMEGDVPEHPNYQWMTLGQIKAFMNIPNLVNMDTRTVLSGIPLAMFEYSEEEKKAAKSFFTDAALYRSLFETNPQDSYTEALAALNNYKMFTEVERTVVPLRQLVDWKVDDYGVTCKQDADFSIQYYNVQIEGREVAHWLQPLLKAESEALFALVTKVENGIRKFLITVDPEIGCMDKAELGPSLRVNNTKKEPKNSPLYDLVKTHMESGVGILKNVIMSEEGGRFYREQNRNVILEIAPEELKTLPDRALWVDYSGLNSMVQANNLLNIQLRNLLSLLDL